MWFYKGRAQAVGCQRGRGAKGPAGVGKQRAQQVILTRETKQEEDGELELADYTCRKVDEQIPGVIQVVVQLGGWHGRVSRWPPAVALWRGPL